ncbi:MAG: putative manganese-dependent inorganic diphosphatase [Eubacteriales bacterium]|nr:putative manganese-dependent inorganic diphosphatase [Eubacteriales bacterium]
MGQLYVFGHKNPDTDAIAASIGYAALKTALGEPALPARLGEMNNETRFVLQYFNIPEPQLLTNIKTQVLDLDIDSAVCVTEDTSIRKAWGLMRAQSRKTLAVTDEKNTLLGVVTLSDITRNLIEVSERELLSQSKTTLKNIMETLCASVVAGAPGEEMTLGGVVIAAQRYDRIKGYVRSGDVVIANIPESIREAVLCGARLIVCTCGFFPAAEDVAFARERKCDVISTACDTYETAMLIRQSIPVSHVMSAKGLITVGLEEFKAEVAERMLKTRYRSYPVVDAENRVVGMISRYHLLSNGCKRAILVDHNEKNQTANGIEEAEILEIIDHHRLGDIQTNNPILMKNEPVGSTSTIVASLYEAHGVELAPHMAGLLLAAIVSDTLNFRSPTCTKTDIETAERLAAIADVQTGDLALKLLNAGSKLRGKTPDDIVTGDLKEYTAGKHKVGIAQVYSIDSESLTDMQDAIAERMRYFCEKGGYSLFVLLVTDLIRGGSHVLLAGEHTDIFYRAYGLAPSEGELFLKDVLSRKKQVLPLLMAQTEQH